MKYVVFGASGFLGKRLVGYLEQSGEDAVAVSRSGHGHYCVDIASADSFHALDGIEADVIVNCASVLPDATVDMNDADYVRRLFETNVIGAVHILNFASRKNIRRVINCSTLSIVKRPWPVPLKETDIDYPIGLHTGYCVSKLSQELLMNEVARNAGIELLHLRLASLYGPGMKLQGILPQLITKATTGEKITLTNAEKVSFDFLYVDDLVQIIQGLSRKAKWQSNMVNVASGEEVFLNELAEKVVRCTSLSTTLEFTENNQPPSRSVVDISLLRRMLDNGFCFSPLEMGIQDMVSSLSNGAACGT